MSHLIAFVLGIIVATIGINGVTKIADNGIQKVQQISKDAAK